MDRVNRDLNSKIMDGQRRVTRHHNHQVACPEEDIINRHNNNMLHLDMIATKSKDKLIHMVSNNLMDKAKWAAYVKLLVRTTSLEGFKK